MAGASVGVALVAVGGAGTATGVGALGSSVPAGGAAGFEAAFARLTGGAKTLQDGIVLELPMQVDNGNTVPFTVTVDSPMSDAEHVRAIHVLATDNPEAIVGTFRLSLLSGRASVSSRLRLARAQEVVTVAEMSDGTMRVARKAIAVVIGGCSSG